MERLCRRRISRILRNTLAITTPKMIGETYLNFGCKITEKHGGKITKVKFEEH